MGEKAQFAKLMEPGRLGRVNTRNRIIKTAAGTGLMEKDGTIGRTMIDFYETMAKGGCGLLIFEYCSVEYPRGMLRPTCTAHLSDDRFIPSYAEMVEAVHKQGCPFFTRLMHSGPWYQSVFWSEFPDAPGDRVGPSTITAGELPHGLFTPIREMSVGEIEGIVETFGKAALRAQRSGFDGIEINGSHYHLINAFFSPFWNRRHDAYGCDNLKNRARFMCSIIKEVKRVCGKDYPVGALFNAVEYGVEKGTTLKTQRVSESSWSMPGPMDSGWRASGYGPFSGILHPDRFYYPECSRVEGEGIRLEPSRQRTHPASRRRNERGCVDTGLPRGPARPGAWRVCSPAGQARFHRHDAPPLRRSRLPRKVAEGRLDDIAPCSGCNYCWHVRAYVDSPLRCRINAALGRHRGSQSSRRGKRSISSSPAAAPPTRGGQGGCVARPQTQRSTKGDKAWRGHAPRGNREGARARSYRGIIADLRNQCTKLGVTLVTGKVVDSSVIDKLKPDVLILAMGGTPGTPAIKGIDHPKVLNRPKTS